MPNAIEYAVGVNVETKGVADGMKKSAKLVDDATKKMTKDQIDQANRIAKIKEDMLKDEKKFNEESYKHAVHLFEKRMEQVKGNLRLEYNAKMNFIKRIAELERKAEKDSAKQAMGGGGGEAGLGKGGRAFARFGESMGERMGEMGQFGGVLQKVLGKLGPVGIAIGAVGGAAVMAGKAAYEAAEKFNVYNQALAGVQSNTKMTDDQLKIFGSSLLDIDRPASLSAEKLGELASQISTFTSGPESIKATTEQVIALANAFPGADPSKIAESMGYLTEQLGSSKMAFDALAKTSKEMGSMEKATEALKDFPKYLEDSGKNANDFINNIRGAGKAIEDMRTPMTKAKDEISTAWENMVINIGGQTEGLVSSVTSGIADALMSVASWFEPVEVTYDKAIKQTEKYNESIGMMQNLLSNPSINTNEQLERTKDLIEKIAPQQPEVAQEMEAILNNASLTTQEQLDKINQLLEGTITLTKTLRDESALDAMTAGSEMLNEQLGETASWWSKLTELAPGINAAEQFKEMNKQLPLLNSQLADYKSEYDKLPAGSDAQSAKLKQIIEVQKQINQYTERQSKVQKTIQDNANNTIKVLMEMKDGNLKNVNVMEAYNVALKNSPAFLQQDVEYQEQLGQSILEAFQNQEELNIAKQQEIDVDTWINEALNAQLLNQYGITDANKATVDQKVAALMATKAQIMADQAHAITLLAQLQAAAEGTENLNQLTAEAATLASKYASNMSGGVKGVEIAQANTKSIIASLKASIGNMGGAIQGIDAQIKGLKVGAPKGGGGGGAPSKEDEELKKRAEELAKILAAYNEAIRKAEEEYIKAMEEQRLQRKKETAQNRVEAYKSNIEFVKANQERLKVERDLRKQIKDFAKELDTTVKDFEKGQLQQVASTIVSALDPVTQSMIGLKSIFDDQKAVLDAEINARNSDIESLTDLRTQLDALAPTLQRNDHDFNILSNDIKSYTDQVRDLNSRLPELKRRDAENQANRQRSDSENRLQLETATKDLARYLSMGIGEMGEDWRKKVSGLLDVLGITISRDLSQTFGSRDVKNAVKQEIKKLFEQQYPGGNIPEEERGASFGGETAAAEKRLADINIKLEELKGRMQALEPFRTEKIEEYRDIEDQINVLTKNISERNNEINDIQGSSAQKLNNNFQILNKIYEFQAAINELLEQKATSLDPLEKQTLQVRIEYQQQQIENLKAINGLSKEQIDFVISETQVLNEGLKGTEKEIIGLDAMLNKMRTSMESISFADLESMYSTLEENMSTIEEKQQNIGDNIFENYYTLSSINSDYMKQREILTEILATREEALRQEGLSSEEHEKRVEQYAAIKSMLDEIDTKQKENLTAISENQALVFDDLEERENQRLQNIKDNISTLKSSMALISDMDFSKGLDAVGNSLDVINDKSATTEDKMRAFASLGAGIASAFAGLPDQIDKIKSSMEETGVGGAVSEVSATIAQIGSALISAPPPLSWVGAVLLIAGTIGNIVGKVVAAVQGREASAADIAEERKATQEKISQEYNSQVDYLKDIVTLGNKTLSAAKEELKYMQAIHKSMMRQDEERERIGKLSEEELARQKAILDVQQKQNENLIDRAERALEYGRDEREALLKELGIDFTGSTKDEVEALIENLKVQNTNIDTTLGMLSDELEYRKNELDLIQKVKDELQTSLELQEKLALRANDYAEAIDKSYEIQKGIRDALNEAFKAESPEGVLKINEALKEVSSNVGAIKAGFVDLQGNVMELAGDVRTTFKDISKMTDPELFAYFTSLTTEELNALDAETKNLINDWIDGWEKLAQLAFDDAENLIGLKEQLGELTGGEQGITKEQALQEKLNLYLAEKERLLESGVATEEQLLTIEIKIAETMKEQTEQLKDQNKEQARLAKLVRERQQTIEKYREGGASSAELASIEQRIRAELSAQGMSQEQIEKFMATLPKREGGGEMTAGLYMAHGTKDRPEWVMNQKAVERYGVDFMRRLNNLEVSTPQTPTMRYLTGAAMANNSNQNINIIVNVDNEWNNQGLERDLFNQISIQQKEALYEAINRGIQSRRINLISGGRV